MSDLQKPPTTALYCRVSTTDQNLARQRTNEYATDAFGIDPFLIEVYGDTDRHWYGPKTVGEQIQST